MNRVVRDHITSKIQNEYFKRLKAETKAKLNDQAVKKAITKFTAAHVTYHAAKEAAKVAYAELTKLGVHSEQGGAEYHNSQSKFTVERYGNGTEAAAWRERKETELKDLEFKLALSKDKMSVVEIFLSTLGV